MNTNTNTNTNTDTTCSYGEYWEIVDDAPPDGHNSWLAWESTMHAEHGGCLDDWPEEAREILRAHEGYLPR